jgi:ATP-binding cassette subfamily B protein
MNELAPALWPIERLHEALESLARHARLASESERILTAAPFGDEVTGDTMDRWLTRAAEQLHFECEAVEASASDLGDLLRRGGPALFHFTHENTHRVALLIGARRDTVHLLGTDLRVASLPLEQLRAAICAVAERPAGAETDTLLAETRVAPEHRDSVRRILVSERLAGQRFGGCWLLRRPPTASFWTQLAAIRVPQRLLAMLATFLLLYALEIGGWTLLGRGALGGRVDPGWLTAWALLLLGTVPLRLIGGWLQGMLATDAGVLTKQRLLANALRMNTSEIREQGAGRLLSRVIESEALESVTLSGGFAALTAVVELSLAMWVLAHGAGGTLHVWLLVAWLAVASLFGWRYYHRLRRWTRTRLDLTHDLVERMVGHRTRMVQKTVAQIHEDEDEQLERYVAISRDFDRALLPLGAGLPRGWLIVGLLGLAPAFISGSADATSLAIAIGGIIVANRALASVGVGIAASLRAAVAAEEIAPLLATPTEDHVTDARDLSASDTRSSGASDEVLVHARNLVFRHRTHGAPVLDGCDLRIMRGDRLLLEGVSGGGKSTLASLLVGLNRQESGLLLLKGLDRATLGRTWRELATAAPQFHENHVLSASFAFNLLMGRRWPANEEDLAEADRVCRDLGLGDLIDRMPSKLMQMVGETGWQLSHGERSRLYLARALLQNAELVVLDESFAALDPETLDQCLRCALERAPTLLVIAHP